MSVYIKRQWPKILGIAAPLFILVLLVGFGVSIFPNNTLYGLPGDPCTFNSLTNCDPCNGEVCNSSLGQCQNFPGGTPNTDPNITDPACPVLTGSLQNLTPFCFDICNRIPSSVSTIQDTFQCAADDQYCQDFSGGDMSNDCRVGICIDNPLRDTNNPSGCDYDYDVQTASTLCMNCEDAAQVGFDNCGNGVCEVAEGEDCQSCPVDCLVPGFDGVCPATTAPACQINIVFPGPPYNVTINALDDGDICTDSTCDNTGSGALITTPKGCSQDNLDFCCPAGCQAPPDGLSCVEADMQGVLPRAECDADCYIPEMCFIPIPTPTPTPTPTTNDLLEGSGILPCSLQKDFGDHSKQGLLSLLSLGIALAGLIAYRRCLRGS